MVAGDGGVLRYTVVVRDPETSAPVARLGGEPVPGWASGLVCPHDLETVEPAEGAPAPTRRRRASEQ